MGPVVFPNQSLSYPLNDRLTDSLITEGLKLALAYLKKCWFCWCWTRIKIWGDQSKQRNIRLSLQYEWKGLFITCPSEEASFIWLPYLQRQGQNEETVTKNKLPMQFQALATCSSLFRTEQHISWLCFLVLLPISSPQYIWTYFQELFRAGHLECCLSAVAIPQIQQSHTNV